MQQKRAGPIAQRSMDQNHHLLGFSPHAFPRPAETQSKGRRQGDLVLGPPTEFKVHRIKEDAPQSLSSVSTACLLNESEKHDRE